MELYDRIKFLCEQKGTTVSALSQSVGVKPSVMSDLKAGRKKSLTIPTLAKLADGLGLPVNSLISDPIEEIQDELYEKRKLLFDLSSKATEEELDKFIKMLNIMMGE